jgi:hypothetical protein
MRAGQRGKSLHAGRRPQRSNLARIQVGRDCQHQLFLVPGMQGGRMYELAFELICAFIVGWLIVEIIAYWTQDID